MAETIPAAKTGAQVGVRGSNAFMQLLAAVQGSGLSGWGAAPPPGIPTWRKIARHPTVRLARVAAQAPVKMALKRAVLEADEDAGQAYADDAAVLQKALRRDMRRWIRHALGAMDLGFAACELVWGRKRVGRDELEWPVWIKPLVAEVTEPQYDARGRFVGCVNLGVKLARDEVLWYGHEVEAGDMSGNPRAESVREVWHAWTRANGRLGQYAAKVAGVTPIIEYPEGKSPDADGQMQDNYDLAVAALAQLEVGLGVVLPNALAAYVTQLAANGVKGLKPEDAKAWIIRFLETAAGHGKDLVEVLSALDKFLVRGYLVPERAVLEGQHGTKADSQVHVDVVLDQGEDVAVELAEAWDEQVVDQIALRNFGPEAVGVFRTSVPALMDAEKDLVRDVVRTVLTTPATLEVVGRMADIESMMRDCGVPVLDNPEDSPLPDPAEVDPAEVDPGEDELSRVTRHLSRLPVGARRHPAGA